MGDARPTGSVLLSSSHEPLCQAVVTRLRTACYGFEKSGGVMMPRLFTLLIASVVVLALAASLTAQTKAPASSTPAPSKAPMKLVPFNLRSADVTTTFANTQILNSFGC